MRSAFPIAAPQSEGFVAKHFQAKIIQGVCDALATQPRAPCLLRSPTGSGKTFVLTKILENVSKTNNVLWLWFVPYVNLVAQTVDTLDSQATETGLIAKHLGDAQNEAPEAGQVLVSTVQGVASAKSRKAGYTDKADDDRRSLATFFELARGRGLEIGLVVDEAHIALDSATEFGHFVKWLKPGFVLRHGSEQRGDLAVVVHLHRVGELGVALDGLALHCQRLRHEGVERARRLRRRLVGAHSANSVSSSASECVAWPLRVG